MILGQPWQIIAVITVIALASLYFFAHFFKLGRLIKDTPTSKIRSAAQGFVELEGIASQDHTPMPSPLSQRPCIWFDYCIEKRVQSDKTTSWRTISSNRHPGPLILDDTTGQCLIRLKKAKVYGGIRTSWMGNSPFPTSLSVDRQDSFLQFGNYRYTETIIPPGSPLYALGSFTTKRPIDGHSREGAMGSIIRRWKENYDDLLTRFDRNKDGKLDDKEWELVRLAAKLEAENMEQDLVNMEDINYMDKASGQPLIVSTEDQRDTGRKFMWYAFFFLLVFAGSIAYFVYIMKPFF